MERTLRYPTTQEIVEYIVEEASLRTICIYLQNNINCLDDNGPTGWCNERIVWEPARKLKEAYKSKKRCIPLSPDDIPAVLEKEKYDDVIKLVENHFYLHEEIYDILPDKNIPSDGDHCMTSMMKSILEELKEIRKRLEARYEELKAQSEHKD